MPRHLISDAHEWINEIPNCPYLLSWDTLEFSIIKPCLLYTIVFPIEFPTRRYQSRFIIFNRRQTVSVLKFFLLRFFNCLLPITSHLDGLPSTDWLSKSRDKVGEQSWSPSLPTYHLVGYHVASPSLVDPRGVNRRHDRPSSVFVSADQRHHIPSAHAPGLTNLATIFIGG
ncbi:hypothetical protein JTE90_002682 [Oedothorax gibbosus]|uniref:Uncharacterized protein n=1 Tax=Oedothorax gibbosus TaxID=931172 RepID=A0AAV6TLA3_9ARAC|nr:hypothetical protein JTE90_002682 [Oedothorax gibbosus]